MRVALNGSTMNADTFIPTRPAGRPLQIYLDSSDYSVLSDAMSSRDHPAKDIFEKLCQLVGTGLVEIRFSSVHVIEIAHIDSGAREAALRRAKCIAQLCNGKCFRFWLETPIVECLNILAGRPVYEGVTSDIGQWHPDLSSEAQSLGTMLIDGFKQMLVEMHSPRPPASYRNYTTEYGVSQKRKS
jgi:hypothetical protein